MSVAPNIYLAPFQGITGHTYRSVYVKHFQGVDKLFTPFFTSIQHNNKLAARKLAELGSPFENGIPVVPQILSKDAEEIIRFAYFCEGLGFSELNWNLGCPYPQVANKKRGSGMLPFPVMVEGILEKVMAETKIKFSVKCRLGYISADEIYKLIPSFITFNISELIVHARTGKQLYSGETDLETFEKIIPLVSVPLAYNGDIFSFTAFERLDNQFNAINSWMIGRGLLWDPFLPAKIKGFTVAVNQKEHIRQFINDLYLAYRKQMNDNFSALSVLKEYWSYLAMSFNDPHHVFKKLKKVMRFEEYEDAVSYVFQEFEWVGSDKIKQV